MFGSDLLDVAIGLVLMFLVFAVAASAIVEAISSLMQKRAKDLDTAIKAMVGQPEDQATQKVDKENGGDDSRGSFFETSVFVALKAASGGKEIPSYVSAKSFADAAIEYIDSSDDDDVYEKLPDPLKTRVRTIVAEVGSDLTAVKAELESWFDETMARLQGAYKRWATTVLFLVGLVLAVATNASAFHVARDLWTDSTLRAAIVAAAEQNVNEGEGAQTNVSDVGAAVEGISAIGLPIGWTDERREVWDELEDAPAAVLATIGGWIATAIFVMLGGPFWFDLLTKLVGLRAAGAKPATADQDETSASATLRLEANALPGSAAGSVVGATVLDSAVAADVRTSAVREVVTRGEGQGARPTNRFSGPVVTRLARLQPQPKESDASES